jgi:hypothetical protein
VLINQSTVMAAGGFPYVISQAGSYKLSGNLTVPDANTTAIQVTADNVTIDFNGFSILGPLVCVGTPVTSCNPAPGIGIGIFGNVSRNVTVVNGTVRGLGGDGIKLGPDAYVEKMHVLSNGGTGINFLVSGIAIGNTVVGNQGGGIAALSSSIVNGNRVIGNGFTGIILNCPAVVIGNVAFSNMSNFTAAGPPNCQVAYVAP